ncbi:MAG TPA: NAD(P)-dependent alcohol dehydrogenase [Vicinamibacteria bacterium]|nr:NAD(P)-dependent alcohol dehydrogenase [Vicinamibacteria bacterium]
MKAIVHYRFGSPDVLEYEEVQQPTAGNDEVLVKVQAASTNPADWHSMRADPFFIRFMGDGLLRPKHTILGIDIAGRVEAVGRSVKQFQRGDEVFGTCRWGGFAEYACAREDRLVSKPAGITFEQAAAVPVAAITALQGLRDRGNIRPGQKVLINGASGGVGTFAVQIAKAFEAEVTGVCSTRNVGLVRSLGADHVIDYTRGDFTQSGQRYDLILDAAAYRSVSQYKRVLSADGIYVMVGGSVGQVFHVMFLGPWVSLTTGKKMSFMMAKITKEDLLFLRELIDSGKVKPVIDRRYPLSEVAEALRYLEEGHARGKVVITV